MTFIWFNSKKAYSQLCYRGHVMTLRIKQKKDGTYILRTSLTEPFRYNGVSVEVRFVKLISSPDELKFYVSASGFNSVKAWLDEAKKLHGVGLPLYLHSVRFPIPKMVLDNAETKRESCQN